MDEDLKAFLEGMETRIVSRLKRGWTHSSKRSRAAFRGGWKRSSNACRNGRRRHSTIWNPHHVPHGWAAGCGGAALAGIHRSSGSRTGIKLIGEFWKWGRMSDARTRQALTEVGILSERDAQR